MANDTRSSRKLQNDENKSSKGILDKSKGSTTSDSPTKDSSGLRRSSRSTSSKDTIIPCPSSSHKSAPTSPLVTKKNVERVEQQCTPSPLRRSTRGQEDHNTSLSSDKKSPVSSIKTKKKETCVRSLLKEGTKFNKEETENSKHAQVEEKMMDSRRYRRLFIEQKKRCNASDPNEQLINKDNLPKSHITKLDCSVAENLLDSKSVETALDCIDFAREDNENPLKRKINGEEMDCDALAASKDTDLYQCVTCSKNQRINSNFPRQKLCCSCDKIFNQEICGSYTPKGRGEEITVTLFSENGNRKQQQMEPCVDMQTDAAENLCFLCKLKGDGILLCCDGKGCKKSYHILCLNPPLDDFPPGAWHCLLCVKKKIESGVHSVSEGIETIWNSKEVMVDDPDRCLKKKQYFVKHKGLAHVHNSWIPESQLLLEAPSLVANFNAKHQVTKWKVEWTMPHRLLKKRLIPLPIQCSDEHDVNTVNSHCEWLVKWRCLDYEHATWELSNASFFNSPIVESLVKEYENFHEKAKRASIFSNVNKIVNSKKVPFTKLVKLPIGGSSGIDNNHLNNVNKLREYWHMGRNAVVFDDEERIMKVISFILSLQSDTCHPFLIISASSNLSVWEAAFHRLARTIDVVAYSGNKDIRRRIRKLELYEEGLVTFQVLLSPAEAIVEDLKLFKCLGWEAIIFDNCQNSKTSTHIEQLKMLATGFRLFYDFGPFKDFAAHYLHILSFLENGGDSNITSDDTSTLKKRLSSHIAYECKSETTSRFAEYWVPAQISDLQLEQYCSTLLSNFISLRSCTKIDRMGGLHELLHSVRMCCDHPYLLDPSLQTLMIKDRPVVEYLDVGIKASGKLQVLDKMLSEIKSQGLRVLVLFQAIGGYGTNSIGTFLDDFLCQRFGPDSYERIDAGGIIPSKKQAALRKFNNEKGRFVFLLENRACLPSIKLSSLDCIIIFDSDWNPMNDLRALQRITIESKSHQIKLFRLYSSCTVEEKALILGKQDPILDSNIDNINSINCQMLLMWGASVLFKKCDEFHKDDNTNLPKSSLSSKEKIMKDLIQEFTIILSKDSEKRNLINSPKILKVQQEGGSYIANDLLLGEHEDHSKEVELLTPHDFWKKLLENKHPKWKYLSGSSQRKRKKVHYNENLSNIQVISDGVVKKRKKVICLPSSKSGLEDDGKEIAREKEGTQANKPCQTMAESAVCARDSLEENHTSTAVYDNVISPEREPRLDETEDMKKRRDAQKYHHLLLKPEIIKLCDILKLKDDVKEMVGRILEYIIDNHHVDTGSTNILQAFQLSLCWIAASLAKQNIDKKDSLAMAKQNLKYVCKEEEVNCIYVMLLKKLKSNNGYNIAFDVSLKPALATEDDNKQEPGQKIKLKAKLRAIKRVEKKSRKRMLNLLQKKYEEEHLFKKAYEEKKAHMEKEYQVELAIVRSIHSHHPSGIDKLKKLEESYEKKLNEHKLEMEIELKNIKKKHADFMKEADEIKAQLLEEVNAWAEVDDDDDLENVGSGSSRNFEPHLHDKNLSLELEEGEIAPDFSEIASNEAFEAAYSDREPEGQTLLNSPLLQQVPDRLNEAVQLQDECSQESASHDGIRNDDTPVNKDHADSHEVEAMPCDPLVTTLSSDAHEAPVVPLVQSNKGGPPIEPSSCAISPSINQNPVEITQSHHATTPSNQLSSDTHEAPILPIMQSTEGGPPIEPSSCAISPSINQNPVEITPLNHATTPPNQLSSDTHEAPVVPVMQSNGPPMEPSSCAISPSINENPVEITQSHHATTSSNQLSSDTHDAPVLPVMQSNEGGPPIEPSSCAISPPIDQNPVETTPSHHAPTPSNQQASVIECVTQLQSNNQPNLPLTGEIEPTVSINSLNQTPIQSSITVSLNSSIDIVAETPVPHPRTTPVIADLSTRPIQTASTLPVLPSRLINQYNISSDPLENESERLRQETEQIVKFHEEKKLRVKYDCEKEIEEAVANIRKKYETILEDNEIQFLRKKQELDANFNKVYMNKMLAEAFRSKYMDAKLPEKQGMMQPQGQLPMQQHMQRPTNITIPSSVSVLAARPYNLVPPRPVHSMSSPMGPPPIHNPAPPQTTSPRVQVVHHPSSLFVNNPTRPLHISTITPSTGNILGGTGIRAPAPHLQRFRPSPANNLPPLPRACPNLQARMPSSFFPQPPLAPPPGYHHPPPPPAPPQPRPFLEELLKKFDNRFNVNMPNSFASQPELTEYRATPISTTTTTTTTTTTHQVNSTPQINSSNDVVYLSDGDE